MLMALMVELRRSLCAIFQPLPFPRPVALTQQQTCHSLMNHQAALQHQNSVILPNLDYLSLEGNPLRQIGNSFFEPIKKSKLTQLNLGNCHLKSIGLRAFSPLNQLQHVDFYGNPGLFTPGERADLSLNFVALRQLSITWYDQNFNLAKKLLLY